MSDRLWSKVTIGQPSECWPWQGALSEHGYGVYRRDNGQTTKAHREVYRQAHGVELDSETDICHSCDSPPCCNPAHLFAGSAADNMADCVAKDRHVRGSRASNAKLTEDAVRAIRIAVASGTPQKTLCAVYGVNRATMSMAVNGKTWRHVVIDDPAARGINPVGRETRCSK